MNLLVKITLFFVFTFVLCSCKGKESNSNVNLQLSSFRDLRKAAYIIHPSLIRQYIGEQIRMDADSMPADHRAKGYYYQKGNFLWINYQGVDSHADTLLRYLERVNEEGFSTDKFRVKCIVSDLKCLRSLNFDQQSNTINRVLARLEYNLTKAYLRYTCGQRFGYTDPYTLLNRLDVKKKDKNETIYQQLFDVQIQRPNKQFWAEALQKVAHDSVADYLQAIQPKGELYLYLKKQLAVTKNKAERITLLCNLDRARWRTFDSPAQHDKYVVVNLPAQELVAINNNDVLKMRIGIGTRKNKTPLLYSSIVRMDINPQWIMPKSIMEKSVAAYAGNQFYFDAHHYFIRERSTGKRMDVAKVSARMLRSGNYFVIQEGGKGNAMGRIVFRFKNNFSVYLHDTSSKNVFFKRNRCISHGCIRVENPFDFAIFLLDKKDKETINKIKYSMTADIHQLYQNKRRRKLVGRKNMLNRTMLINSLAVKPAIPLFVTYYTMLPDSNHKLHTYPDVYGYDNVIYHRLRNYMR